MLWKSKKCERKTIEKIFDKSGHINWNFFSSRGVSTAIGAGVGFLVGVIYDVWAKPKLDEEW